MESTRPQLRANKSFDNFRQFQHTSPAISRARSFSAGANLATIVEEQQLPIHQYPTIQKQQQHIFVRVQVEVYSPPQQPQMERKVSNRPSTLLIVLENILQLIQNAAHNKQHANTFKTTLRKLWKAMNGIDYSVVRQAEFYSDLKETLLKLKSHLSEATNRRLLIRLANAKKDKIFQHQVEDHIDMICGRIAMCMAQRCLQKAITATQ